MAILGNAAGTTSRAYEEFFPRTRVDGVEIDPELSAIGRRYFDMNNPRLHLYHEDARPFMRRIDARYDVVSVDAYSQPYIPFYLTTKEFFESVRDRLAPDGVVLMNVGHPEGQDGLEKVLTATVGEVFAHVLRDPVKDTNTRAGRERRAALGRADEPRRAERCRSPCGRRPRPPPSGSSRRCAGATSTRTTGRPWSGWSTSPSSTTRAGSERAGRRGDHRRRHRRLRRRPRSSPRPA